MVRLMTTLVLCLAICAGIFINTVPTAHAVTTEQGQLKPSDTSIYNLVTMDCLAVKFKLSDIHQQDGLLRVTLGQAYETMSTKLMARLNARVVENKLDGAPLVKSAAEFETALSKFRDDYKKYEVSMNTLMKADCQSQIQTYYVALESTRELRTAVDADTKKLSAIIDQYYKEFTEFQRQLQSKEKEANDNATE